MPTSKTKPTETKLKEKIYGILDDVGGFYLIDDSGQRVPAFVFFNLETLLKGVLGNETVKPRF